jgi:hypothetical protein
MKPLGGFVLWSYQFSHTLCHIFVTLTLSHRCEVGTDCWSQCNDTPVKFARFPVTGLIEGRSYIFRVRAVNKTGIGLPSRVSEPVAALDPAEKARLKSKHFSFISIFLNL